MSAGVWGGVPAIVPAIAGGLALMTAGTVPWALLAAANQRFFTSVPWAVIPASLYLWLFWEYAGGKGWPRSSRGQRRLNRRATPLSDGVWAASLLAGTLGLAAVLLLFRVVNRLLVLPQEQVPDVSHMPAATVALLLVMASVVAGVVEEVSFRGYMQRPIEQRHGPAVAILVTGLLFGFVHFTHPEVTLVLLPYYAAIAAVYGTIAHLTDSILPGLVLHAIGNVFYFMQLLGAGRADWQTAPTPVPLIWTTGADASFWISCALAAVVASAAIWSFVELAATARAR